MSTSSPTTPEMHDGEPLYDAIDAGDVEQVARLLAAGADPNAPFKTRYGISYGLTPLQVAVYELQDVGGDGSGLAIDAIVLLLRYGAQVNAWDEGHTTTALLCAVMNEHGDAVHILLAAGADPNVRGDEGDSPLRFCAANGRLDMARLLLQCGASKTIDEAGGAVGMNALGWAATRLDVEMVRLLLAYGANPEVWDYDKMTPLDRFRYEDLPEDPAAQERFTEICKMLGADAATVPIQRPTGVLPPT